MPSNSTFYLHLENVRHKYKADYGSLLLEFYKESELSSNQENQVFETMFVLLYLPIGWDEWY